MKCPIKKLSFPAALIASLCMMSADRAQAQIFTIMHGFTTNDSGHLAQAPAGLVLSGNTLYGASGDGGSFGSGMVYSVSTDGTGFTTLYSFTAQGGKNGSGDATNSDGAYPNSPLVLSGDTLYGTTLFGGAGAGTVFTIHTDGSGFTNLHNFDGNNRGGNPQAGVVLSGNTLYGTTRSGGIGWGTVFAMHTDGTGFTNLHVFDVGGSYSDGGDGYPYGGLILSGDSIYGTTSAGGNFGFGTVFAMHTDGTGFTILHSFANSDGASPFSGLVLSGNTLYGTTEAAGNFGNGTVFAVNTDGTGFTVLHSFAGPSGIFTPNTEGAKPYAGLVLSGNALYGTTSSGGSWGGGTVFKVNTDGTDFLPLYSFTGGTGDGGYPTYGVILSGNTLFGVSYSYTQAGGTVFSLTLPFQLSITRSGSNVILTWPTNAAGLALQSTPSLVPPVGWTGVPSDPVVVNGLNIVTNPMSGDQQFYQLVQPVIGN